MSPFLRRPVFLVKVWLDQCAHEFGEPPCVAAGTPCYYTYQTCKDQDNFSRSSVAHRFCLNQGPQLPNAAPLVADVQDQEAEIRPGENITQVGNYKIKFLESPPRIWANPDKPLLITKQNKETAGTFWKNLWARHSDDYLYRPVEIWRGYWGSAESTYQLYFRGVLEEWNLTEDGAELICRDHLIRLREKAPDPQDSENVLTAAYSGGAAMNVSKAFQFTDPATVGGAGLVQIEDDTIPYPCYVSYTGRSLAGNQLTGCVAGKFGSPNDGHIAGCRVKNVLILAANNAAAGAGWAAVEGLPLDTCLLDLLVYQARISGLDLAAPDNQGISM